jgi:hypothetical protein
LDNGATLPETVYWPALFAAIRSALDQVCRIRYKCKNPPDGYAALPGRLEHTYAIRCALFYQGAWLARKVAAARPLRHVDIGSSVMNMGVLSAFADTTFVDYRPLKAALRGLDCIAGDILNLPFANESVGSLSCLHVIEHIGLGRYGDSLDPQGSIKAALELQRVTGRGGALLLSLPVGRERVCFNAHRVHSPLTVPKMRLVEFSYVDDNGQFHEARSPAAAAQLEYDCGMYYFEKR